jgi:hypothetical protein
VLSVSDPQRYAIYDARVATSLNAIQVLERQHVLAFPYPPGRNSEIDDPKTKKGFSDIFSRKHLKAQGFQTFPRDDTYQVYLTLLRELTLTTGKSMLEIEMQLFGRAVEFSKLVRQM